MVELAPWPPRKLKPWDDRLRAYIDTHDEDLQEQIDALPTPEELTESVGVEQERAETAEAALLAANVAEMEARQTGDQVLQGQLDTLNALDIAEVSDISNAIEVLTNASPELLNTFAELGDALGDDPNFATTMMTLLSQKATPADIASAITTQHTADLSSFSAKEYELAGVELASVEVTYSFATAFAVSPATANAIIGARIIVPPTEGPVLIKFGCAASVTVAGLGLLQLQLWYQEGPFTTPAFVSQPVMAAGGVNPAPSSLYNLKGEYSVEGSSVPRTYFLAVILYRDSGSLTANVPSTPSNTAGLPTYLKAYGS
jgi:hypothetical protein